MSSAGQAVGGLVGGVIGFFVGGPAGAFRGAQIGMMVGGAIDPPKGPTINGPRLEDLSVQTSTYGAFIPRAYGTVAQAGNVFWMQGDALIEVQTSTTSGGKGGPETTTNTWSYYATFAVGLCKGPIDGVRRIWIGGQLWYDAGSDDLHTIIASNQKSELFTLYLGTDTQTADPLMQADKGVANVSAHRGLAYIVFDALPLEKYGNSLMGAQVKCEIIKSGSVTPDITLVSSVASGSNMNAVRISGRYAFVTYALSVNMDVFDLSNVGTPVLVSSTPMGYYTDGLSVFGDYAYVFMTTGGFKIVDISNPLSPSIVGTLAIFGRFYRFDVVGGYAYGASFNALNLQIFDVSTPSAPVLAGTQTATGTPYDVAVDGDYAYLVSAGSGVNPALQIYHVAAPTVPTLVASTATASSSYTCVKYRDGYAFCGNTNYGGIEIYDVSVPASPSLVGSCLSSGNIYDLALDGDYLYAANQAGSIAVIDISDVTAPSLLATETMTGQTLSVGTDGDLIYVPNKSTSEIKTYIFSRTAAVNTATLGSIVEDESLLSKILTAGDLDVTELTDTVRGYRVSQLGAIRGAIDPLRAAWPFDVVQNGYQIKFKRRGSTSVATIPASLLDARAAGEAPGVQITDAREMDLMLPRRVDVQYLDSVREYDINEQLSPERTSTDAAGIRKLDMPIVFTAAEAAQKAETLLYLYWLERYDVSLRLPPEYSALEPGDVITVTSDTANYQLRLASINTMPDGRIECAAKYNQAAIYTPVAMGEEGQSTGGTLTLAGPSVYSLLDIPLLRDDDDTAGFPVAMAGYLAGWPGGVLYRSDDAGQTWADLRAFAPGAVLGYATTTLAAHGGTVIDFSSTLSVRLYAGTLASVTQAQMFAGQNWFAYGAHGRWEIIAAATAVLQGDGSYILSDFLRGQRGTEWATGLHVANDRIVLLDANSLEFISVNSSTIGAARDYRAITTGKALNSDASLSFAYAGVNLECLSPVHLTGSRHPSTNDWSLTWTRRSRFDQWRDYVDVPLGEASESYEIDIYSSGTYATVVRTITASSATAAYTSAQQVADFGSNQATLYVKVYQLSATVGRGYPLTQSITR